MATHRPHALKPRTLAAALGVIGLTALTTATSMSAPSAPSTSTHTVSASCGTATDWNTMVPEGQCRPGYAS